MIVQEIQKTKTALAEWQEVEKLRSQAASIDQTRQALRELEEKFDLFRGSYRLLAARVEASELTIIAQKLQTLLNELDASATQFDVGRNQSHKARELINKVEHLSQDLQRLWSRYVENQHSIVSERYRIMAKLPGISEHEGEIAQKLKRLAAIGKTLPTASDLEDLENIVVDVETRLSTISDIPEGVQLFLQKVSRDGCTLADLTDDVLVWCREHQFETLFKITY